MRLIDKDALMEYCGNQKSKTVDRNDIARFPTAQPQTGHWTSNNYGISDYCSECGKSWINDYVEHTGDLYLNGETPNFCPHCGAKMVTE